MIVELFLAASIILNVFLCFACVRFTRRLFQFDDLFATLVNDIDVNVKYFEKLTSTDLFENSPEVQSAHNNMKIVGQRMDEFILRMEDVSGRELRKVERKEINKNPPVVS